MAFKASLSSPDLARDLHLEVFTNDRCEIKASREVASDFEAFSSEVETALCEAIEIVSRGTSVRAMRAGGILDNMRTLSTQDEVERMIIVTLCDIIIDLLVTEKLSRHTHKRQDLENESVGAKISMLRNQYRVPVYKHETMRDIRTMRNKIAHGGATPPLEEANFALDSTIDIFETF